MSIRSDPNLRQTKWDGEPQSSPIPNRGRSLAKGKTHHFLFFDVFLGESRSKFSIYFVTSQWAPGFVQDLSGQNIVEQQTPKPPKIKDEASQTAKRAIFPSLRLRIELLLLSQSPAVDVCGRIQTGPRPAGD